MKIFVLDTSAVMGGFAPGLSDAELVTVKEVLKEAKDLSSKLELETAVMLGKVRVQEPSQESLQKVGERVEKTGDQVSETDVKLLAMSLDLRQRKAVLLTDDYAIQNLAVLLDIPYQKVAMPGIKEVFSWAAVCPACKKAYPPSASECPACGSALKRRPRRA